MDEITRRWSEFYSKPYPPEAHIDDADLELLDSDIAGCIGSFIGANGKLELKKVKALERSLKELDQEWEKIPDMAKEYFGELRQMGEEVLSYK